jgi:hypothetical protein
MEVSVTPALLAALLLSCLGEQNKYKEEGRRESRSTLYSTLAETEETQRARTVQDFQSEVRPRRRGRGGGGAVHDLSLSFLNEAVLF